MAYIDPGTGSMALQVILAGALGSVIALRKRISSLMHRLFGRKH